VEEGVGVMMVVVMVGVVLGGIVVMMSVVGCMVVMQVLFVRVVFVNSRGYLRCCCGGGRCKERLVDYNGDSLCLNCRG
jgi:hypothetical protein